MNAFQKAKQLAREGKAAAALAALNSADHDRDDQIEIRILRADLQHRLGNCELAETDMRRLLRSSHVSQRQRALCYLTLGRIAAETGQCTLSAELLQKAAHWAILQRDFTLAAWAQARLLTVTADAMGAESIRPLLGELRVNVLRSGDPHVLAAMHIYLGQTEAQRNALSAARRHLKLGTELLESSSNVWLEAMAEHLRAAIDIMSSDLSSALNHGARAVALAEQSAHSLQRAATYANYGYTLYLTGDLSQSDLFYNRALELLPKRGDHFSGAIDTLARIHLERGDIESCERILTEIESAVDSDAVRSRYVYRHSLLTRVRLQMSRRHFDLAKETIDLALRAGLHTDDRALVYSALVLKAELSVGTNDIATAATVVDELACQLAKQSPDKIAAYNVAVACLLAKSGDVLGAAAHRNRAQRLYELLGHQQGSADLKHAWTNAAGDNSGKPEASESRIGEAESDATAHRLINTLAALLAVIDRPELCGAEFLQLLKESDAVDGASAEHIKQGESRPIDQIGDVETHAGRHITLNSGTDKEVRVFITPKKDLRSLSTVNAILTIAGVLDELGSLRRDNEQRRALWPPDPLAIDGEAVIAGQMRDVLATTQRVAPTKVTVLVVGESGTGKEIIARAVHEFSNRANKPFVPLNCAAVPQHLVESTLFGHRRGAFTGADHDSPGLIRSARDGTLFLDEIGELALDLQPKLLRFLESGEIAPLGDPNCSIVDVRIVAATNRNLGELVQQGRFREDLFYRLNVVRLTLNPLRERRDEIPGLVNHFVCRFAKEFNKGYIPVAEETMERLLLYRWPGNIRQLQNEIRRMVALIDGGATLEPEMIADDILAALPLRRAPKQTQEVAVALHDKLPTALAKVETAMIKAALYEHHGKVDNVAKALGISRKGLYLKRHRLGI